MKNTCFLKSVFLKNIRHRASGTSGVFLISYSLPSTGSGLFLLRDHRELCCVTLRDAAWRCMIFFAPFSASFSGIVLHRLLLQKGLKNWCQNRSKTHLWFLMPFWSPQIFKSDTFLSSSQHVQVLVTLVPNMYPQDIYRPVSKYKNELFAAEGLRF